MVNGVALMKKIKIVLSLVMLVPTLVCARHTRKPPHFTCVLYNHTCVEKCPEGMHRYDSDCTETFTQATCDSPAPMSIGLLCYWSRCDCNGKRVLHRQTARCYLLHECPEDGCEGELCGAIPDAEYDKMEYAPAYEAGADLKYTGHCPTLKFSYGKCYGDNTRQIKRDIRSKHQFRKPMEYRPEYRHEIENVPQQERPFPDYREHVRTTDKSYVTGYTGYIPGLNFRYGKPYSQAADDSMASFLDRQRETRRRREDVATYLRSRSAPRMDTVHNRDEVQNTLRDRTQREIYKETSISAEFPPIAGYTGHIPRIKGNEASLSQRYHCAAKRGLELIEKEREERQKLINADARISTILRESGHNRAYWNWG